MAEYDIPRVMTRAWSPPSRAVIRQKIVLARELGRRPTVLLAFSDARPDPGATRFVIERVLALREAGAACSTSRRSSRRPRVGDRIGVLHAGRLVGVMRGRGRCHPDRAS